MRESLTIPQTNKTKLLSLVEYFTAMILTRLQNSSQTIQKKANGENTTSRNLEITRLSFIGTIV